ncbi:hypothetical protein NQ315_003525 [Exocentrus adspersus]|uniref:DDE Tnp4 domain-containing protein n=1 Tax=Exocentrus adspersus TaxID=1586481 RepID=A0AAV8V5B9_9CUCU|nr:hypothetical protein NQ315_003525 [Exocentrus adspersus]
MTCTCRKRNYTIPVGKRADGNALHYTVEWGFSKIISQFAFIDFKKNQKLLLQNLDTLYKVAVLLTNAHTCLYGHQVSDYFNVAPINLEQYFCY